MKFDAEVFEWHRTLEKVTLWHRRFEKVHSLTLKFWKSYWNWKSHIGDRSHKMLRSVKMSGIYTVYNNIVQLRPYAPESTGSRPISKVKLVTASSVLWWGTTREYGVLKFFIFLNCSVTSLSAFIYNVELFSFGL